MWNTDLLIVVITLLVKGIESHELGSDSLHFEPFGIWHKQHSSGTSPRQCKRMRQELMSAHYALINKTVTEPWNQWNSTNMISEEDIEKWAWQGLLPSTTPYSGDTARWFMDKVESTTPRGVYKIEMNDRDERKCPSYRECDTFTDLICNHHSRKYPELAWFHLLVDCHVPMYTYTLQLDCFFR